MWEWGGERTSDKTNEQIVEFPRRLLNCQNWLIRIDVFVCLFVELRTHACSHQSAIHIWQVDSFKNCLFAATAAADAAFFIFIYLFLILFWLFFCFYFVVSILILILILCICVLRTSGKVVAVWPNNLTLSQNVFNERVCMMGVIVSCVFFVKAPIFFFSALSEMKSVIIWLFFCFVDIFAVFCCCHCCCCCC